MIMINNLYLNLLLVLIVSVTYCSCNLPVSSSCPQNEALVRPCRCEYGIIICHDQTGVRIKEMFAHLSNQLEYINRHIHMVQISGIAITQLPDNVFSDITVNEIVIRDAPKLRTISDTAFKGTKLFTKRLVIHNCPQLQVDTLWTLINKLREVSSMKLCELENLREIPTLAFKELNKLRQLLICGPSVRTLHEKAFFKLTSLARLDIVNTGLTRLHDNSFVFEHPSRHMLTIGLFDNRQLTAEGLSAHTFAHMGRPVSLDFSGYNFESVHYRRQMPVIHEHVFRPFFKAHELNDINLYGQEFECQNCKNVWLKKEVSLHEKLLGLRCIIQSRQLMDVLNFKSCQ
ncbi:uncharacterized protein LOC128956707 [Oppia nitens]|uniref:uncharacterized protein LOC128956707 n=1 Tax=Oppia nitens TaxID=1686743 RepID=UPI0023DCE388|nr:uncharacterized protein LOC128956707 [Oppia nitens]